jgi:hypothetical protein
MKAGEVIGIFTHVDVLAHSFASLQVNEQDPAHLHHGEDVRDQALEQRGQMRGEAALGGVVVAPEAGEKLSGGEPGRASNEDALGVLMRAPSVLLPGLDLRPYRWVIVEVLKYGLNG